jgi:DsbC/DsbD-like thiol-disulfide interchange protein
VYKRQEVALLPGWTESDGSMIAAIRIDLNPGWKTYWRVPGAAGIPPNFDWTGSTNFRRADVMFPAPVVEYVGGLQSIGYHDEVVFPIRVTPDAADQTVDIALHFTFGACEEICIPVERNLSLHLDPLAEATNQALIQSALNQRPLTAKGVLADCEIMPNGDNFLLSANIRMQPLPNNLPVVVFETASSDLWIDVSTTRIEGNSIIAEAPMQFYGQGGLVLERSKIRLTLLGGGYAVDIQGCPA